MPDGRLVAGARLAVTTFTVLPLRAGRVDRPAAAVAMSLAPLAGALLGVVLAAALLGLTAAGAPPLVAGVAVVALGALLTRGLHLDGLADTVDALGSHRSGEAALQIMKKPDVGPFGVAALTVVLLLQATALAALPARGWAAALAAVVAATAAGRLAVSWACRRGVPAARPDGLGALVAGTVPASVLAVATVAVAATAFAAAPGRPWQGPAAVLAALAVAVLLIPHVVRRFGGITGDVLGAAVEVTTTVAYLGLILGR
ncbi:adenosylcobinamide-GDP ribazoletransferase [Micromonospora sp. NPDC049679]|uniref:adenosylcobinamide-GDP ribazoletransferase n=1 Tax=Micromonospora sp. NPDC049679 TaxID=3155920 RepID=UPI0033CA6286